MLTARTFTMASAELDYSIEIPDQPCWSQSMEGVWGGGLTAMPRPPCRPALPRPAHFGGPAGLARACGTRRAPPPAPRPQSTEGLSVPRQFLKACVLLPFVAGGPSRFILILLFWIGLPTSRHSSASVARPTLHFCRLIGFLGEPLVLRKAQGFSKPSPALLRSPWQWLTERSVRLGRTLLKSYPFSNWMTSGKLSTLNFSFP